jgi:hypothetical protein
VKYPEFPVQKKKKTVINSSNKMHMETMILDGEWMQQRHSAISDISNSRIIR